MTGPDARLEARRQGRTPHPRKTSRSALMMTPVPADRNTGSDKLTIPEVCAELQIERSTFYYWRQTRQAPRCIRLPNGKIRVQRADLDAWIENMKDAA
jgi:predicted DNA-binding transcriptional regulator AlpA